MLPAGCDRRITAAFDYWRSRHGDDGALPGRKSIDPVDMRSFLADICLYEVQQTPIRFRYRVAGTQIVARMEHDFTGRWLDEVHPRFVGSPAHDEFVAVARRALPYAYYRGIPLFHTDRNYAIMERILVPLAQDGVTVDMMLAVVVFDPLLL
jgi:hypothetical protein